MYVCVRACVCVCVYVCVYVCVVSARASMHTQVQQTNLEGRPSVLGQLLNLDGVDDILHDGVSCGGFRLSVQMVFDFTDAKHAVFLEHPLRESRGQSFVG